MVRTKKAFKRKREDTAEKDTSSNTTSLNQEEEEEEASPMAPAQDSNDKKPGNDLEGRDFYEVLGIKKDATPKEITIAYRKLALKIHPDKNQDDPHASDKFQTLGKIHMTLSDPEKRKIYDETGETSDEAITSGQADWTAYFNLIFKKLTKKDIRDFGAKYRGSDEEKKDVLDAYTTYKGNLKKVLEVVMVSRDEDLGRFATYCQQAIDAGEVKAYPGFKKFEKYVGKDLEIKEDEKDEDEIPKDLIASFAQRKTAFDNLIGGLEAKYGNKKGGDEEGGAKKKKKVAPAKRGVGMKKKRAVGQKKKVVQEEEEEISDEGEEMEA